MSRIIIMKEIFLSTLILSIVSVFSNCNKEVTPLTSENLIESVLDEMSEQKISGLALIVTKNNKIVFENYFGKADRGLNIDVTEETKFLLASVSKTVAATALMQLYDKDSFELDDAINDYLPFSVHPPNTTTDITFRMILEHTSGITDGPSLDGEYYWGQDSPTALGAFLSNYFTPGQGHYDATANFTGEEPGAVHDYSNIGSALGAYLVEAITGVDFATYCNQNIFQRACMNASSWRLNGLDTTKIAQPYEYENGAYKAIGHYTFTDYPNGGLRATAKDLTRFLVTYQQGGSFNNQEILKNSTVDLMLKESFLDDGNGVGLHWFTYDRNNRNIWGHDGGESGVTTMMGFNKITGIGLIILTNSGTANLDQIMNNAYDFGLNTENVGSFLGC